MNTEWQTQDGKMTTIDRTLSNHDLKIAKLTSYITSDLMFLALVRPDEAVFKSASAIAEEAIRRVTSFHKDGALEEEIERQEWDPDEQN